METRVGCQTDLTKGCREIRYLGLRRTRGCVYMCVRWSRESVRETFSRKLRQCKWNVASLMKCSILEKRYFETGAEEYANRLTFSIFVPCNRYREFSVSCRFRLKEKYVRTPPLGSLRTLAFSRFSLYFQYSVSIVEMFRLHAYFIIRLSILSTYFADSSLWKLSFDFLSVLKEVFVALVLRLLSWRADEK